MGLCSAAIGPFCIFLFLISLFLSWHVENDPWSPIATYVGVYRFTFTKTTSGQALSLINNYAGKINDKAKKASELVEQIMKEGSFWIWEAREMFCAQDILGKFVQDQISILKERCQMWSKLAIGSYIVFACFLIGSCALLAGSFLNKNKPTLSESTNMVRIVCCAGGSGLWILGCLIYLILTMYFPSGDEMTFSAGFWLALVASILSLSVIVVAQFVESDVVGSQRVIKGEQGVEMQAQGGGKGGMGQQMPGGKGQPFPGQPGAPMSQGFVPPGQPPGSGFALAPPPSYNQPMGGSYGQPPMSGGYPPQGMGGMSSPFLR